MMYANERRDAGNGCRAAAGSAMHVHWGCRVVEHLPKGGQQPSGALMRDHRHCWITVAACAAASGAANERGPWRRSPARLWSRWRWPQRVSIVPPGVTAGNGAPGPVWQTLSGQGSNRGRAPPRPPPRRTARGPAVGCARRGGRRGGRGPGLADGARRPLAPPDDRAGHRRRPAAQVRRRARRRWAAPCWGRGTTLHDYGHHPALPSQRRARRAPPAPGQGRRAGQPRGGRGGGGGADGKPRPAGTLFRLPLVCGWSTPCWRAVLPGKQDASQQRQAAPAGERGPAASERPLRNSFLPAGCRCGAV